MNRLFIQFSVIFAVAKTQQEPTVIMFPTSEEVFAGEALVLNCSGSGSDQVKWYFKEKVVEHHNQIWIVTTAASSDHAGQYSCERGQKSNPKEIKVLNYVSPASLVIKSGDPVVYEGTSVVFELEVEDGLTDWFCRVLKGGRLKKIYLKSISTSQNTKIDFHPRPLKNGESTAIYWCESNAERSNAVAIKTSKQMAILEPPSNPVSLGETMKLECVVWGRPIISKIVFKKDDVVVQDGSNKNYEIPNVDKNHQGTYSCIATYKFKDSTSGSLRTDSSDGQEIEFLVNPLTATITMDSHYGLSCSCTQCTKPYTSQYFKIEEKRRILLKNKLSTGVYYCRAVWVGGASRFSNTIFVKTTDTINPIHIFGIIAIILIIIGILIAYLFWKKRTRQEPLYQDVPLGGLKSQEEEARYQALKKPRVKGREGDYDTLKVKDEVSGEKQKEEREEGEGGEGGYNELKMSKEEREEGLYHTLGAEGGKGGGEAYEAL